MGKEREVGSPPPPSTCFSYVVAWNVEELANSRKGGLVLAYSVRGQSATWQGKHKGRSVRQQLVIANPRESER